MTPDMIGYSEDDVQELTTTRLHEILLNEPLTVREIRIIKAEIKTRII